MFGDPENSVKELDESKLESIESTDHNSKFPGQGGAPNTCPIDLSIGSTKDSKFPGQGDAPNTCPTDLSIGSTKDSKLSGQGDALNTCPTDMSMEV